MGKRCRLSTLSNTKSAYFVPSHLDSTMVGKGLRRIFERNKPGSVLVEVEGDHDEGLSEAGGVSMRSQDPQAL
jgi:hypothetical protein